MNSNFYEDLRIAVVLNTFSSVFRIVQVVFFNSIRFNSNILFQNGNIQIPPTDIGFRSETAFFKTSRNSVLIALLRYLQ